MRLLGIIAGAKVYKDLLADYMEYRGLEAELLLWSEKYGELAEKIQMIQPNSFFENLAKGREAVLVVELERLSKVETLKTEPLVFSPSARC